MPADKRVFWQESQTRLAHQPIIPKPPAAMKMHALCAIQNYSQGFS
jgi:hypothetical protein